MGGSHLVSASTDSALRLWDLRDLAPVPAAASSAGATSGGSGGGGGGGANNSARCRPAVTYTGHRNQRNFVGLSVSPDGRILCGSEDNSVHCYSRSLPFSTARYSFAAPEAPAGGPAGGNGGGSEAHHQPFVSAVCWANRSRHCLAANSQGLLQILQLE
jgi:WD40 repeat protein